MLSWRVPARRHQRLRSCVVISADATHSGPAGVTPGGIGAARAREPGGPFQDYLGRLLIDKFHNGAQPIDQFVFRDNKDGAYYIVSGGWRHCNIARLNDDFTGFLPFPDGSTFKEITPQGNVEGAFGARVKPHAI